jgi:hypothetical protein
MAEVSFWAVTEGLEGSDAYRTVSIDAEDLEEGKDDGGCCGDDCTTDDGHLALVDITAPDRKPAGDHRRDAENETKHHDHREAVADAGFELCRIETLRRSCESIEGKQSRNQGHSAESMRCRLELE